MKTLETERLIIRPVTAGDLPEIHCLLYADPSVAFWWTAGASTFEQVQARWAPRLNAGEGDLGWVCLVRKAGGELLGIMAFQRYVPGEDHSYMVFEDPAEQVGVDPARIEAELTYALGRAFWGQGYAVEAGRAMVAYGFAELGIDRIVNSVNSINAHSVGLMKRLGFRIEKNLHPKPHTNTADLGVIGFLANPRRGRAST